MLKISKYLPITFFRKFYQTLLPEQEGEMLYRSIVVFSSALLMIIVGIYYIGSDIYSILLLNENIQLGRLLVDLLFIGAGIGEITLLRYRRVRLASLVVVLSVWVITTMVLNVANLHPLHMAVAFGYFFTVVLAIGLLNRIEYWLPVGIFVVVSYVTVYILWNYGIFSGSFPVDSSSHDIVYFISWIVATGFVGMMITLELRTIRDQFDTIRKNEKRLELVMEATSDGVFDRDISDNQVYYSPSYFEMLGYEANELPHTYETFENLLHPDDLKSFQENLRSYISGESKTAVVEHRFRTKTGEWKWILSRAKSVDFDDQGKPTRFIGTHVDIDEQKKIEEELRLSEERYRLLSQTAEIGVGLYSADGEIIFYNELALNHIGATESDVVGKNLHDLFSKEHADAFLERIKLVAETRDPLEFEDRVELPSGEKWFLSIYSPVARKVDELYGVQIMSIDITKRKKTEDALQESEQRFGLFMEQLPGAAYIKDEYSRVVYCNRLFASMVGLEPHELIGKTTREYTPSDIADRFDLENKQVFDENRTMEFEHVFPGENGPTYWLTRKFPLVHHGSKKLLGVISLDITERKLAEDALIDSERILNQTGEVAKVGGWEVDLETGNIYLSYVTKLIHEAPVDFTPSIEQLMEYYLPDDEQIMRSAIRKAQESGVGYDLELQITSLAGNLRWVRVIGRPEFQDGVCVRLWGTIQDITALKAASEKLEQYSHQLEDMVAERTQALQESEQRYRRLSDASQEAIFIHRNNIVVEVNQAFIDLFGYSADEIIGKDGLILTADEERHLVRQKIKDRSDDAYDVVMVKKNGTKFPAWAVGREIPYGGVMHRVVTVRDLTERREMEKQLIQAERLATLGRLAGSVGHELRNPLGAIKNGAYFLNLMNESTTPEIKETIQIINREVDRSNKIIKDLLDFTRVQPPKYAQVDIHRLLTELLFEKQNIENIEFDTRFDEDLSVINADEYHLAQIFNNLICNAIQAMPNGGRVTIETQQKNEEWIRVSVQDTGEGVLPENREKIFEPLFTTKAQGIGLGLPLVKTLVEGHHGLIDFESEPGDGSIFIVRLPT